MNPTKSWFYNEKKISSFLKAFDISLSLSVIHLSSQVAQVSKGKPNQDDSSFCWTVDQSFSVQILDAEMVAVRRKLFKNTSHAFTVLASILFMLLVVVFLGKIIMFVVMNIYFISAFTAYSAKNFTVLYSVQNNFL